MKTFRPFVTLIAIGLLIALGTTATAQDAPSRSKSYNMKTLLGPDTEHGIFFAGTMNGTKIQEQDGLLLGGKLGWVIDHWFTVGFGGYGLTNPINLNSDPATNSTQTLQMGYGGLYFEPRVLSEQAIHLAFPIIVGSGGANLASNNDYFFNEVTNEWEPYTDQSDAFFVVEPGVELEINIARNLRVGLGGSYRFVEGLNVNSLESDALDGINAGVTMKIGVF